MVTTLSTPPGRPTSSITAATASVVSGVSSAGLTHHRAPGRDGRADLAGRHRYREVPRRDQQAGPDRLAHRQQPAAPRRGVHPAAVHPRRLLGVPPEELRAVGHLALRLREGLAHFQADQLREVVGPLEEHLEGAAQHLPALARRGGRPARLRGAGGVQGVRGVRASPVGDLGEVGLVRRVVDDEAASRPRLAPGATDEECPVFRAEQVESGHGSHCIDCPHFAPAGPAHGPSCAGPLVRRRASGLPRGRRRRPGGRRRSAAARS